MIPYVPSLNTRRYSKTVLEIVREEYPHLLATRETQDQLWHKLREEKVLSDAEFNFLQVNLLLREMSEIIYQDFNAIGTGFFFFCPDINKVYYANGCNYPRSIRNYFDRNPPLFNCFDKTPKYYDENNFMVVQDLLKESLLCPVYKEIKQDGVRSMISYRLEYNDRFLASFQVYFDEPNQITEEMKHDLEFEMHTVAKTLYDKRKEMLSLLKDERSQRKILN